MNTVCEKTGAGHRPFIGGISVRRLASASLPTEVGEFTIIGYRSLISDEEFVVLTMGTLKGSEPVLARIHSQCLTGDVFGSVRCDCGRQLDSAMRMIANEGRGVIIYQQQEGRGIGIMNKIRAYALQDRGADTVDANRILGLPVDARHYEQCAEILVDLGIRRIRLISNNPEKVAGLETGSIHVIERVPATVEPHAGFARYLRTKRERMGHFSAAA